MKVILKEDIKKLGRAWEIVIVKDGFARNFLFPKGLALEAKGANLKIKETISQSKAILEEKEKKKALDLLGKLENASFTLALEANTEDKLYGSLNAAELAKFLKETEGYEIDKKNIILDEPIKSLGVYNIEVKLHPEVSAKIKIWIVKK